MPGTWKPVPARSVPKMLYVHDFCMDWFVVICLPYLLCEMYSFFFFLARLFEELFDILHSNC